MTYHFIDAKDCPDIDTSVDVTATVQGVKHDAVATLEFLLDENRVIEFFRDEDGSLARGTQSVDHDVIGEDIQFLLFFALDIGFTSQTDAIIAVMSDRVSGKEMPQTNRLIKRALRTLVAMNLEVNPMALRSSVRSPVASGPRRNCSERMWLAGPS